MFDEDHSSSLDPIKNFFTKLTKISKKSILFVFLSLVGLSSVLGGWWHLVYYTNSARVIEQGIDEKSDQNSPEDILGQIWIDVSGAVVSPGTYQLSAGSRVSQAIKEASGFSQEADAVFITQKLNLADRLVDGQKIYIPTKLERELNQAKETLTAESEANSLTVNSSGISINTASNSQLESLPGIGEKRAQDIIDNRPYLSLKDLTSKKVISNSLFEDIESDLNL